jgi:3',5'-nucleoside bisphosphate phosphatase
MRMLERYCMDLHIHTCLSPCGDPTSVPTRIVQAALRKELDAIAICDHNGSENVGAVRSAAHESGLTVFGGMEISSREEIHMLGIFGDDDALQKMQQLVYAHLPGSNNVDAFGPQYIVDCEDYVEGCNNHLLIGATDLDVEAVIQAVHEFGGIVIASHIDREAFGIISQLGFIPQNLGLDAVELSKNYKSSPYSLNGLDYPLITSSDAHSPEDIGSACSTFLLEAPTIEELQEALTEENGRKIVSIT